MLRINSWKLIWRIKNALQNNDSGINVWTRNGVVGIGDNVEIIYEPRRLRVFDKVDVRCGGTSVFVPLIPRILLRRFVRNFLTELTMENIK